MRIAIEPFLSKENINDELFYTSLISELQEIVEEELGKNIEQINVELIDDCCIAIENLQTALDGGIPEKYEALSGVERIIKQYNRKLRSVYIASVACAAMAVLCATTVFKLINKNTQDSFKPDNFLSGIIDIYEQTITNTEKETIPQEQLTTVQTEETENSINNETSVSVSDTTEEVVTYDTTQPIPHIYKLTALLPTGFTTEYTDKTQINLSQVKVKIRFSDETEKIISVDECDVEIGTPDKNGRTKITIKYGNMDTGIYVNIRSEEDKNPLTLNSIYGEFNDGYNVESMRVYAVYSDGTQKEIPEGSYTVKKEYSEDFEAEVVIVEYGGCSFQFLPQD